MTISKLEQNNILTHMEYIVDDEMRNHAFCPKEFSIDEQIFRLLTGYREALEELKKLKRES